MIPSDLAAILHRWRTAAHCPPDDVAGALRTTDAELMAWIDTHLTEGQTR